MKSCIKCFENNQKKLRLYSPYCLKCNSERIKKYYKKNEKYREYAKNFSVNKYKKQINGKYKLVHKSVTLEERIKKFWEQAKLNVKNGCWEWQGYIFYPKRTPEGYGKNGHPIKNEQAAHRISYTIANDVPIPKGYVVRHGCNNTICVNPYHLDIGTVADNNKDKIVQNKSVGIVWSW